MRILAIIPAREKTGASLFSKKLYLRLPSEIYPGRGSFISLLSRLLRKDVDVYHVQFEYRSFGGFPRSVALLVLLSMVLSLRRPVVVTLHGLIVPESVEDRRFGWLSYFAFLSSVRISGLFTSAFIVQSQLMQTVLKRVYRIRRSVVIPCGTDSDELFFRESHNPTSLVFFGFIRPSKGIENLIDALASVRRFFPKVELIVAGSIARQNESNYLSDLHRKVEQHNLVDSVKFENASFGSSTERTRFLSDAITIVLPYTDNFIEISGVVHDLAEYGVPIICSRTPRFSELTDEFDCIKTTPDPRSLTEAILRLIEDSELRSRLGANLRLKAKRESWDRVAEHHLSLYRKLITRGGLVEDFPSQ